MRRGNRIAALIMAILVLFTVPAGASTDVRQSYYDKATAPMVVVLNYHHFGEEGAYPLIDNIRISPEEFRRQLETLKAEGYTTISQAQLIAYVKGVGQIPQKSLYITIDDGFQSTYTYAYPILKELGMTATLFPIISDVERGERLDAPMTTWDQLREMAESSVLAIGNHTYNLHWRYQELEGHEAMISNVDQQGNLIPASKRRAMIKEDLVKAEAVFKEKTGLTMAKAISYPFGAYDAMTLDIVRELAYEIGFTTTTGYHILGAEQGNPFEIKRHGVNYRNTTEKLLQTITASVTLAKQKYEQRNLRVLSHYTPRTQQLYMKVSAVGGYTSVANVQYELWQNENGQRTYVAPAPFASIPLSAEAPYFTHTEHLKEQPLYDKAKYYSLKIIMTNVDGSVDNEWINFMD